MSFSPKVLALLGLAATNLFWASNAVIARYASADIPPFTLAFGRWLLAFLILLPFVWSGLRGHWRVIRQNALVIAVLGLLGITIYNTILYLAAHATTAVNITLVSSSLPLITLLMTWLMLGTRPGNWQILGIVASLSGVLMIILRGDPQALLQLSFNQGDVLIFLIACAWSCYSVILRKYPIELDALPLLAVLIGAGLPGLALLSGMELSFVSMPQLDGASIGIFIYIAIFPSLLAYAFWGYGVKRLGPNIAALSSYLMPLFTALLAVPILHEQLYSYHLIGGLMILVGLYFGVLFKTKKA